MDNRLFDFDTGGGDVITIDFRYQVTPVMLTLAELRVPVECPGAECPGSRSTPNELSLSSVNSGRRVGASSWRLFWS